MNVNNKLSTDCRELINELKRASKGGKIRTEVNIITLSGGYVWGAIFSYFDDEGVAVAEESFYTMKGNTRRVSGFIVLFDDQGNAFDGEMQNFFLPDKSKTVSEFVMGVIGEDMTPSVLTILHSGIEIESSCEIPPGKDEIEPEGDYPCSECDGDEDACGECECAVCDTQCDEEIRLKCDCDPFDEEDDDDDDDEDSEDNDDDTEGGESH